MMLYLTGASSSISKSNEVPQDDVNKSLGGYISTTPVPNGGINAVFDLISMTTIKDKVKETIAVALVNKLDVPVENVSLKIISNTKNVCKFNVAAVEPDDNFCMEHINNRYSEPINAEFYDATFYRSFVDVEIKKPAIEGEEMSLSPFNVEVEFSGGNSYDDTYNSIAKAFLPNENYRVERLTERIFRIESKADTSENFECSYIATDVCELNFLSDFRSPIDNEVLLTENLEPNKAIGIWLQREILNDTELSDEELLKDYEDGKKLDTLEEIEILIDYNLTEIPVDEEPEEEEPDESEEDNETENEED